MLDPTRGCHHRPHLGRDSAADVELRRDRSKQVATRGGKRRIELIENEVIDYHWQTQVTRDLVELRNIVAVAKLVIGCALQREESRGLHTNQTHPEHANRLYDTSAQRIAHNDIAWRRQSLHHQHHDTLTKVLLCRSLSTVFFSAVAYGDEEIYSYIDKDGTLVFTNIKPTHLKPTKEERLNTFSWTDELGVLRKVHRVNVTSYDREILEAASTTHAPELVKAVVAVESSFEPTAISPAGARIDAAYAQDWQEMELRDPFHPRPILCRNPLFKDSSKPIRRRYPQNHRGL